nr:hypothetical protein KitaXyl93_06340 [Kitasatospora sp. Xyl93]
MNPRAVARFQGLFDLVGGAWPVLHVRGFEEVVRSVDDGAVVGTWNGCGCGSTVGSRVSGPNPVPGSS